MKGKKKVFPEGVDKMTKVFVFGTAKNVGVKKIHRINFRLECSVGFRVSTAPVGKKQHSHTFERESMRCCSHVQWDSPKLAFFFLQKGYCVII